jgi:hypothetical protein
VRSPTPPIPTPTDSERDRAFDGLVELVRKFGDVTARARALGLFVGDRDLLECPACGLMEDVLADGRLVVYRNPGRDADTGLRFAEAPDAEGRFSCPGCGASVPAPVESPRYPEPSRGNARRPL